MSAFEDKTYNVINTEFILHFANMKLSRCHPFCKYASSLKWDKSWFLQVWNSFTKKFSCLLTPWSRVLLEKLTGSQPVKKFPSFYGTRKFITAFTSVRHQSLSWASWIKSIPTHPTSHFLNIDLNIVIPTTPGSPKCSLSFRFPYQNPVYASPVPHTCYMPCPSHTFCPRFLFICSVLFAQ